MTLPLPMAGLACGLLVACGSGNPQAVQACEAAVAARLDGRSYQLDGQAMRSSARQDEGVVTMSGPLVIDAGMTSEQRQTVECRVRGDDVIFLNFIW